MISFKIELGNKPKKDGTRPLFLRITQDRKLKRVSLGISVSEQHYNPNGSADKENWIRSSHPVYKRLNREIADKISDARQVRHALKQNATGRAIVKAIKAQHSGKNAESFIAFSDSFVSRLDGKEYNTHRGMKSTLTKLKQFLTDCQQTDLFFSELTVELLDEYEGYLIKKLKNSVNTVEKELSRIRAIVNDAVKKDKLPYEKNPFLRKKLSRKRSEKVRLSEDEIQRLKDLPLQEGSLLWHVRNAYLFSFYCAGIRCGDLLSLKHNNIVEGRLIYRMNKTSTPVSHKLFADALRIVAHYQPASPTDFIFPFFDKNTDYSDKWFLKQQISAKNALLNKYLKMLSEKAQIQKISFHTARHTFANIGMRKTRNVHAISKALGHSNIRITEAYLASFDTEAVDEAMNTIYQENKD